MTIGLMSAPYEAVDRQRQIAKLISNGNEKSKSEEYADGKMGHSQLNYFTILDCFGKSNGESNGACLTPEAWIVLKSAVQIAMEYHYDDSDSMVDYFDTNFYLIALNINHK